MSFINRINLGNGSSTNTSADLRNSKASSSTATSSHATTPFTAPNFEEEADWQAWFAERGVADTHKTTDHTTRRDLPTYSVRLETELADVYSQDVYSQRNAQTIFTHFAQQAQKIHTQHGATGEARYAQIVADWMNLNYAQPPATSLATFGSNDTNQNSLQTVLTQTRNYWLNELRTQLNDTAANSNTTKFYKQVTNYLPGMKGDDLGAAISAAQKRPAYLAYTQAEDTYQALQKPDVNAQQTAVENVNSAFETLQADPIYSRAIMLQAERASAIAQARLRSAQQQNIHTHELEGLTERARYAQQQLAQAKAYVHLSTLKTDFQALDNGKNNTTHSTQIEILQRTISTRQQAFSEINARYQSLLARQNQTQVAQAQSGGNSLLSLFTNHSNAAPAKESTQLAQLAKQRDEAQAAVQYAQQTYNHYVQSLSQEYLTARKSYQLASQTAAARSIETQLTGNQLQLQVFDNLSTQLTGDGIPLNIASNELNEEQKTFLIQGQNLRIQQSQLYAQLAQIKNSITTLNRSDLRDLSGATAQYATFSQDPSTYLRAWSLQLHALMAIRYDAQGYASLNESELRDVLNAVYDASQGAATDLSKRKKMIEAVVAQVKVQFSEFSQGTPLRIHLTAYTYGIGASHANGLGIDPSISNAVALRIAGSTPQEDVFVDTLVGEGQQRAAYYADFQALRANPNLPSINSHAAFEASTSIDYKTLSQPQIEIVQNLAGARAASWTERQAEAHAVALQWAMTGTMAATTLTTPLSQFGQIYIRVAKPLFQSVESVGLAANLGVMAYQTYAMGNSLYQQFVQHRQTLNRENGFMISGLAGNVLGLFAMAAGLRSQNLQKSYQSKVNHLNPDGANIALPQLTKTLARAQAWQHSTKLLNNISLLSFIPDLGDALYRLYTNNGGSGFTAEQISEIALTLGMGLGQPAIGHFLNRRLAIQKALHEEAHSATAKNAQFNTNLNWRGPLGFKEYQRISYHDAKTAYARKKQTYQAAGSHEQVDELEAAWHRFQIYLDTTGQNNLKLESHTKLAVEASAFEQNTPWRTALITNIGEDFTYKQARNYLLGQIKILHSDVNAANDANRITQLEKALSQANHSIEQEQIQKVLDDTHARINAREAKSKILLEWSEQLEDYAKNTDQYDHKDQILLFGKQGYQQWAAQRSSIKLNNIAQPSERSSWTTPAQELVDTIWNKSRSRHNRSTRTDTAIDISTSVDEVSLQRLQESSQPSTHFASAILPVIPQHSKVPIPYLHAKPIAQNPTWGSRLKTRLPYVPRHNSTRAFTDPASSSLASSLKFDNSIKALRALMHTTWPSAMQHLSRFSSLITALRGRFDHYNYASLSVKNPSPIQSERSILREENYENPGDINLVLQSEKILAVLEHMGLRVTQAEQLETNAIDVWLAQINANFLAKLSVNEQNLIARLVMQFLHARLSGSLLFRTRDLHQLASLLLRENRILGRPMRSLATLLANQEGIEFHLRSQNTQHLAQQRRVLNILAKLLGLKLEEEISANSNIYSVVRAYKDTQDQGEANQHYLPPLEDSDEISTKKQRQISRPRITGLRSKISPAVNHTHVETTLSKSPSTKHVLLPQRKRHGDKSAQQRRGARSILLKELEEPNLPVSAPEISDRYLVGAHTLSSQITLIQNTGGAFPLDLKSTDSVDRQFGMVRNSAVNENYEPERGITVGGTSSHNDNSTETYDKSWHGEDEKRSGTFQSRGRTDSSTENTFKIKSNTAEIEVKTAGTELHFPAIRLQEGDSSSPVMRAVHVTQLIAQHMHHLSLSNYEHIIIGPFIDEKTIQLNCAIVCIALELLTRQTCKFERISTIREDNIIESRIQIDLSLINRDIETALSLALTPTQQNVLAVLEAHLDPTAPIILNTEEELLSISIAPPTAEEAAQILASRMQTRAERTVNLATSATNTYSEYLLSLANSENRINGEAIAIAQLIPDNNALYLVARDQNSNIVAQLISQRDRGLQRINVFSIPPKLDYRGLADLLMQHFLNWHMQRMPVRISIPVNDWRMYRYFTELGFEIVPNSRHRIDDVLTVLEMQHSWRSIPKMPTFEEQTFIAAIRAEDEGGIWLLPTQTQLSYAVYISRGRDPQRRQHLILQMPTSPEVFAQICFERKNKSDVRATIIALSRGRYNRDELIRTMLRFFSKNPNDQIKIIDPISNEQVTINRETIGDQHETKFEQSLRILRGEYADLINAQPAEAESLLQEFAEKFQQLALEHHPTWSTDRAAYELHEYLRIVFHDFFILRLEALISQAEKEIRAQSGKGYEQLLKAIADAREKINAEYVHEGRFGGKYTNKGALFVAIFGEWAVYIRDEFITTFPPDVYAGLKSLFEAMTLKFRPVASTLLEKSWPANTSEEDKQRLRDKPSSPEARGLFSNELNFIAAKAHHVSANLDNVVRNTIAGNSENVAPAIEALLLNLNSAAVPPNLHGPILEVLVPWLSLITGFKNGVLFAFKDVSLEQLDFCQVNIVSANIIDIEFTHPVYRADRFKQTFGRCPAFRQFPSESEIEAEIQFVPKIALTLWRAYILGFNTAIAAPQYKVVRSNTATTPRAEANASIDGDGKTNELSDSQNRFIVRIFIKDGEISAQRWYPKAAPVKGYEALPLEGVMVGKDNDHDRLHGPAIPRHLRKKPAVRGGAHPRKFRPTSQHKPPFPLQEGEELISYDGAETIDFYLIQRNGTKIAKVTLDEFSGWQTRYRGLPPYNSQAWMRARASAAAINATLTELRLRLLKSLGLLDYSEQVKINGQEGAFEHIPPISDSDHIRLKDRFVTLMRSDTIKPIETREAAQRQLPYFKLYGPEFIHDPDRLHPGKSTSSPWGIVPHGPWPDVYSNDAFLDEEIPAIVASKVFSWQPKFQATPAWLKLIEECQQSPLLKHLLSHTVSVFSNALKDGLRVTPTAVTFYKSNQDWQILLATTSAAALQNSPNLERTAEVLARLLQDPNVVLSNDEVMQAIETLNIINLLNSTGVVVGFPRHDAIDISEYHPALAKWNTHKTTLIWQLMQRAREVRRNTMHIERTPARINLNEEFIELVDTLEEALFRFGGGIEFERYMQDRIANVFNQHIDWGDELFALAEIYLRRSHSEFEEKVAQAKVHKAQQREENISVQTRVAEDSQNTAVFIDDLYTEKSKELEFERKLVEAKRNILFMSYGFRWSKEQMTQIIRLEQNILPKALSQEALQEIQLKSLFSTPNDYDKYSALGNQRWLVDFLFALFTEDFDNTRGSFTPIKQRLLNRYSEQLYAERIHTIRAWLAHVDPEALTDPLLLIAQESASAKKRYPYEVRHAVGMLHRANPSLADTMLGPEKTAAKFIAANLLDMLAAIHNSPYTLSAEEITAVLLRARDALAGAAYLRGSIAMERFLSDRYTPDRKPPYILVWNFELSSWQLIRIPPYVNRRTATGCAAVFTAEAWVEEVVSLRQDYRNILGRLSHTEVTSDDFNAALIPAVFAILALKKLGYFSADKPSYLPDLLNPLKQKFALADRTYYMGLPTLEDVDAVANLRVKTNALANTNFAAGVSADFVAELAQASLMPQRIAKEAQVIEQSLTQPKQYFYRVVRDEEGRLIGEISATLIDKVCTLRSIYVDQAHWGTRLAHVMMTEFLHWRDPGVAVDLNVSITNWRARRFYARYNFFDVPGSRQLFQGKLQLIKMRLASSNEQQLVIANEKSQYDAAIKLLNQGGQWLTRRNTGLNHDFYVSLGWDEEDILHMFIQAPSHPGAFMDLLLYPEPHRINNFMIRVNQCSDPGVDLDKLYSILAIWINDPNLPPRIDTNAINRSQPPTLQSTTPDASKRNYISEALPLSGIDVRYRDVDQLVVPAVRRHLKRKPPTRGESHPTFVPGAENKNNDKQHVTTGPTARFFDRIGLPSKYYALSLNQIYRAVSEGIQAFRRNLTTRPEQSIEEAGNATDSPDNNLFDKHSLNSTKNTALASLPIHENISVELTPTDQWKLEKVEDNHLRTAKILLAVNALLRLFGEPVFDMKIVNLEDGLYIQRSSNIDNWHTASHCHLHGSLVTLALLGISEPDLVWSANGEPMHVVHEGLGIDAKGITKPFDQEVLEYETLRYSRKFFASSINSFIEALPLILNNIQAIEITLRNVMPDDPIWATDTTRTLLTRCKFLIETITEPNPQDGPLESQIDANHITLQYLRTSSNLGFQNLYLLYAFHADALFIPIQHSDSNLIQPDTGIAGNPIVGSDGLLIEDEQKFVRLVDDPMAAALNGFLGAGRGWRRISDTASAYGAAEDLLMHAPEKIEVGVFIPGVGELFLQQDPALPVLRTTRAIKVIRRQPVYWYELYPNFLLLPEEVNNRNTSSYWGDGPQGVAVDQAYYFSTDPIPQKLYGKEISSVEFSLHTASVRKLGEATDTTHMTIVVLELGQEVWVSGENIDQMTLIDATAMRDELLFEVAAQAVYQAAGLSILLLRDLGMLAERRVLIVRRVSGTPRQANAAHTALLPLKNALHNSVGAHEFILHRLQKIFNPPNLADRLIGEHARLKALIPPDTISRPDAPLSLLNQILKTLVDENVIDIPPLRRILVEEGWLQYALPPRLAGDIPNNVTQWQELDTNNWQPLNLPTTVKNRSMVNGVQLLFPDGKTLILAGLRHSYITTDSAHYLLIAALLEVTGASMSGKLPDPKQWMVLIEALRRPSEMTAEWYQAIRQLGEWGGLQSMGEILGLDVTSAEPFIITQINELCEQYGWNRDFVILFYYFRNKVVHFKIKKPKKFVDALNHWASIHKDISGDQVWTLEDFERRFNIAYPDYPFTPDGPDFLPNGEMSPFLKLSFEIANFEDTDGPVGQITLDLREIRRRGVIENLGRFIHGHGKTPGRSVVGSYGYQHVEELVRLLVEWFARQGVHGIKAREILWPDLSFDTESNN